MIEVIMNSSGNWQTSTPLQCRHDSGFRKYPGWYQLIHEQEFSPIRNKKSANSDVSHSERNVNHSEISDKNNPKRLIFRDFTDDSGIASSISESISKSQSHQRTDLIDENCNFTSIIDCIVENKPYQSSKYICEDHSHEKIVKFNKCSNANDLSKVFKSYVISSKLVQQRKENKNSKFDFLYEFEIRNCISIVSAILSYLSDEDLRQAHNVCKTWQSIVSNDKSANKRRILYLNNKKNAAYGPNKENKFKIATPERNHKSAFISVTNIKNVKQPLIFDSLLGRFDSFFEEIRSGGSKQTLLKCPKCRYPARIDISNKFCCTRNLCKHEFCKLCLGPHLDNHLCLVPELDNSLPSIIVGSKKSRKNLRRLKA